MREQKKFLVGGFYLLFFLSGVAALVYQSLWLRMFTLVLGNSLHSVSVVFSSFMGGLGLGALLFGRYVRGKKDVLGIYIVLELGIAAAALAVGKAIPHLSSFTPFFHRWLIAAPFLLSLFRLSASFLLLLIPTALIGGTLPVLTHFLTRRLEAAGKRIGGLYGWNTVGAVLGCAATGFWLLRIVGMNASLYAAAGLNLFVALAALALRFYARDFKEAPRRRARNVTAETTAVSLPPGMRRLLLGAATITGMAALAYEVVWARFLCFLLHNDIYAYYLMLSTVLLGIGAGSLFYARWLDRLKQRLRLLAFLEIGLGLIVGICYLTCAFFYRSNGGTILLMRFQSFLLSLFENPFFSLVAIKLIYTLVAVFLPSAIMGIAFPLICRLYLVDEQGIGSGTGSVYAVNTAGAIIGALVCGFFLVPNLGVQPSLFMISALNLSLGFTVLFCDTLWNRGGFRRQVPVFIGAGLVFCLLCFLPGNQVREFILKDKKHARLLYYREGLSGTVAVLEDRVKGIKTLYINSIAEVQNDLAGMQTFKVMGHLPLLLHSGNPEKVLMVTFGGGIASGAVTRHPVKVLDVVELEPAVVDASDVYLEENRGILSDPRLRLHLEDGRNHLAYTDKRHDVIISDSTNPASTDSWLLYTLEFYNLCRERLAPAGIMAQWLPVHSGSPESYCTIVKTFQTVFPHTSIWFTTDYTLLIGTPEPLSISYPDLLSRISEAPVREDLAPYCLDEPLELLDCFLMGEASVRKMVEKAGISTDNLPFYQLTTTEQDRSAGILSMLEAHRERIFPLLRGLDDRQAGALRDSLETYYRSQAFLLRRDFPGAAVVNPSSCKVRRFYREYQEEVPYIEAIAKYDPGNYYMQLRAALTLVRHREFARARKYFLRLLALNPDDASTYSTLGNIDFRLGDYRNAALNYSRALELDSKRRDLLTRHGRALLASGRTEEALEALNEAVQFDKEDLSAYFNLGLAYSRLEKAGRAAASYEKVLGLDPDHLEALVNLGSIYLGLQKTERAGTLFRRAARLSPQSYSAWRGLGIALFRLGRYEESTEAFKKVLEIAPEDKLARQFLEKLESMQGANQGMDDQRR